VEAVATAAVTVVAATVRVVAIVVMEAKTAAPADGLTVARIPPTMTAAPEAQTTTPPRATAVPATTPAGIGTQSATNSGIRDNARGIEIRPTSTTNHGTSSDYP
jgi:hypothetical protein